MSSQAPAASRLAGVHAARRFVELLTGSPDTAMCWRSFPDSTRGDGQILHGALDEVLPILASAQNDGHGVFVVVNEGGDRDADVTAVRALFIDGDNIPLPAEWHTQPSFIVQRSPTHWHSYWLVDDCQPKQFTSAQQRLAAYYRSDKAVSNPSRVMRVPGFIHAKNPSDPQPVTLIDKTSGTPGEAVRAIYSVSLADVTRGLPNLPLPDREPTAPAEGRPILLEELRKMLSYLDPTFGDDQAGWIGLAKAIRYHGLPVVDADDAELEQLLDEWCSGDLWRERTGDDDFAVLTYHGRDEVMHRTGDGPRTDGPQITIRTIYKLAVANGYQGSGDSIMDLADALDRSPVVEAVTAEDSKPSRFKLRFESDWKDRPLPVWIVPGMIEEKTINLHYGDEQVFKSSVALEIACGVASGLPIFGAVGAGDDFTPIGALPVVYVAGEGIEYIERVRIPAWKKANQFDGFLPLATVEHMPEIQPGEELDELITQIAAAEKRVGKFAGIFIDTVARALGALDENATRDMGLFIKACDILRQRFGAFIWNVHHVGADKSRSRGSTRLPADSNARFRQTADLKTLRVWIENEKQKNGPRWDQTLALQGRVIELDVDGDRKTAVTFERAVASAAGSVPSYELSKKVEYLDEVRSALYIASDAGKRYCGTKELASLLVQRALERNPDPLMIGQELETRIRSESKKLRRGTESKKSKDGQTVFHGMLRPFLSHAPEPGTRESDLRWRWVSPDETPL